MPRCRGEEMARLHFFAGPVGPGIKTLAAQMLRMASVGPLAVIAVPANITTTNAHRSVIARGDRDSHPPAQAGDTPAPPEVLAARRDRWRGPPA